MQLFLISSWGLLQMANIIAVGDIAPDFALPDTQLKPVHLKEFQGHNIVLVFLLAPSQPPVQKRHVLSGISRTE